MAYGKLLWEELEGKAFPRDLCGWLGIQTELEGVGVVGCNLEQRG